jgi:hypothetical protein
VFKNTSQAQAVVLQAVVLDWCYGFYNHDRRHSSAAPMSSINYEDIAAADREAPHREALHDSGGSTSRRKVREGDEAGAVRLGDHHDAFVTQGRLRELGDEAADTGDNAFVFGVPHAREERALIESDDQFVREWSKASKKKRRRWLSG